MIDKRDPTSFAVACMDFFGKKLGQTTAEFVQEMKALNDQDRAEIREGLLAHGYNLR